MARTKQTARKALVGAGRPTTAFKGPKKQKVRAAGNDNDSSSE